MGTPSIYNLHNALINAIKSKTFLKTRTQRLLDGLVFVEKGLGVQVLRMLIMSSGLYTGDI